MKHNQKVVVLPSAPYHQGKIGYVQFEGEQASEGTIVLSSEPKKGFFGERTFFAVDVEHIKEIETGLWCSRTGDRYAQLL